jgi:hypothetical protein
MIRQESTALTVLAFLNILMGSIGLLICLAIGVCQFIALASPLPTLGVAIPFSTLDLEYYLSRNLSSRWEIAFGFTVLSLAGYAMLLLAGVGLVYRRRWAWRLTLAFVILNVLHTVVYVIYQFGVVLPAVAAYAKSLAGPDAQPLAALTAALLPQQHAMNVLLYCLPVVSPIVVLCLMFLPSVRLALETGAGLLPGVRDALEQEAQR